MWVCVMTRGREEFRILIHAGKPHPWFHISNYGNVISHMKRQSSGNGGGLPSAYDPDYSFPLKRCIYTVTGGMKYARARIAFPIDYFEDTPYRGFDYAKTSESRIQRSVYIHKAVMDTFRPLDEYPPPILKNDWLSTPQIIKDWIKMSVTINHVNHNSTDNYVDLDDPTHDNIEYVTPLQNIRKAIHHYDGRLRKSNRKLVGTCG